VLSHALEQATLQYFLGLVGNKERKTPHDTRAWQAV